MPMPIVMLDKAGSCPTDFCAKPHCNTSWNTTCTFLTIHNYKRHAGKPTAAGSKTI